MFFGLYQHRRLIVYIPYFRVLNDDIFVLICGELFVLHKGVAIFKTDWQHLVFCLQKRRNTVAFASPADAVKNDFSS